MRVKEITVDNIKIEVWKKGDSARYLGQKIMFEEQETEIKNRLKAVWAAFHKYRQELTSKDYLLCHRLLLFSMVITPTLTYASGTWTLTLKHEKMIKTAQRKMLRLIVQTKRKYKKNISSKEQEETDKYADEESKGMTDKETEEGSDQNSKKDQDSDVSCQEDIEEEIDATENEEDCIEYIKRSTKEAEEHMKKNTRYHAELKYTEDLSGEGQEELFPYLKKGGPEEFSTGIPDLTTASETGDRQGDQKKMGRRFQRIPKDR